MEPLTLRYVLAPEEVAEAMFDHLPAITQQVRKARFWAVVALAVGAALLLASPPLAPPGLLFGGFLLWQLSRSRQVRARLPQVRATPSYTAPTMVVADPMGLRTRTELSDGWTSWGYWDSVASTDRGVALVLGGGWGVHWIPARAFATREQQDGWARQAADGISAAAAARSQPVA